MTRISLILVFLGLMNPSLVEAQELKPQEAFFQKLTDDSITDESERLKALKEIAATGSVDFDAIVGKNEDARPLLNHAILKTVARAVTEKKTFNLSVVRYFLENGTDPDQQDSRTNVSALGLALSSRDSAVEDGEVRRKLVDLLISYGANPWDAQPGFKAAMEKGEALVLDEKSKEAEAMQVSINKVAKKEIGEILEGRLEHLKNDLIAATDNGIEYQKSNLEIAIKKIARQLDLVKKAKASAVAKKEPEAAKPAEVKPLTKDQIPADLLKVEKVKQLVDEYIHKLVTGNQSEASIRQLHFDSNINQVHVEIHLKSKNQGGICYGDDKGCDPSFNFNLYGDGKELNTAEAHAVSGGGYLTIYFNQKEVRDRIRIGLGMEK